MAAFAILAIALLPVCGAQSQHDALQKELQVLLNAAASKSIMPRSSVGYSLGVALSDGTTISLSAGPREHGIGAAKVQPTDRFLLGSATKMYTAAAILRLVEAGKFGLDDKALPLMDSLWKKLAKTSLADRLGSQMEEVTVRQLLQMQSGIPDFDTNPDSRSYQYAHPKEDLGPVEEVNFLPAHPRFDCSPGTCGHYSSTNYELLGLILAQQAGVSSWDEYKQASGLPADVLADMPTTVFPVHGLCSNFTQVHGYGSGYPAKDVFDFSCTGGWTCGNVLSNAGDAAVFVRALYGTDRIVSQTTRDEMTSFKPLTKGFAVGTGYGLGTFDVSSLIKDFSRDLVGHAGETYGYNSITAYSKKNDFSLSITANDEQFFISSFIFKQALSTIRRSLGVSDVMMV